jgi:hypothetical protein
VLFIWPWLLEQVEERLEFYDKGTAPRKNIAMMQAAMEAAGPEYAEANGPPGGGAAGEKKSKKKRAADDDADDEKTPKKVGTDEQLLPLATPRRLLLVQFHLVDSSCID